MKSSEQITGIDLCEHAIDRAAAGELPEWEHVERCAVCLRRWRIAQAELEGGPATDHTGASRQIPRMVEQFADGQSHLTEPAHQGFYAHLAECQECEQDFAYTVLASLVPAHDTMPAQARVPRWQEWPEANQPQIPETIPPPRRQTTPAHERLAAAIKTFVFEWASVAGGFAQWVRNGLLGALPETFALSTLSPAFARYMGEAAPAEGSSATLAAAVIGPVVVSFTAMPDPDEVRLDVRRAGEAGSGEIVVRVFQGTELDQKGPPRLLSEIQLAAGESEASQLLNRTELERGRIEVDALP